MISITLVPCIAILLLDTCRGRNFRYRPALVFLWISIIMNIYNAVFTSRLTCRWILCLSAFIKEGRLFSIFCWWFWPVVFVQSTINFLFRLLIIVDIQSRMWQTWATVSVPQRRMTFHYCVVLRALKPVKPLTSDLLRRIRYSNLSLFRLCAC